MTEISNFRLPGYCNFDVDIDFVAFSVMITSKKRLQYLTDNITNSFYDKIYTNDRS